MNKFKAFTVMELVIVLLISTIIISIAYLAFTIVSHGYENYAEEVNRVSEILLVEKAMKWDAERADIIRKTDHGFACIQDDTLITYQEADSLLIRSKDEFAADTFHIHIDSLVLSFEDREQLVSGGIVDRIKTCLKRDDRPLELLISKWYSAETLMEETDGRH